MGVTRGNADQGVETPKSRTAGRKRKASATDIVVLSSDSEDGTYVDHKGKGKKKKNAHAPSSSSKKANASIYSPEKPTATPSKTKAKKVATSPEEKRPKRFRPKPPANVIERMDRCRTQKMIVLDRQRNPNSLEEIFTMAGTTGNVYRITICTVPHCDCPDGTKNGTCKHILYIMMKVLKAPADLVYQAGLLKSELEDIFAHAPPPPSDEDKAGKQKPLADDDCPICYCPFEEGENVVYCKARCGTNVHKTCFQGWAKTKRGGSITCVMCREPWQDASTGSYKETLAQGKVGDDGYVNVGHQLGLNQQRDTSSYSEWYDRRRGYG